ncbi:hypothetical protein Bpfe_004917 [Biomphalaria pfeifferi]|uniref:SGNH domain-containing protein n=1 Tax=Biomphalaria pfeifferi TaxID=112525 RepID=A0AAD8C4Q8_BIOPF|nr:hypothetical protein Bpfe_004917 [Biomphalaria pfeifferi]
MVQGRWSYRNYTIQEVEEVETIVRRQRSFHKIPEVLQRRDGRCGNVNYEGLEWFRALCNPKGSTPCCYNNICVNRTVNECQCEGCFDFRAKKYAELAEWIPDDHSCKIRKFQSKDEVCRVLGNTTIYFIGDSFMRQLYISVLGFFEEEDSKNIFVDNTSPAIIQKCDKHYRYIAECRHSLKHDFSECNARIHCEEMYSVTNVGQVLNAMKTLTGKNNSWFLVGFGAHDSYNTDLVQKTLLEPLLSTIAELTWPMFVWYEPQAAGHLKTQRVPEQLNPRRMTFNAKINALMEKHNVPVIKFYNMTSQVLSYDGSHYGKGVNDVKAHILLNYILEERGRLRSR